MHPHERIGVYHDRVPALSQLSPQSLRVELIPRNGISFHDCFQIAPFHLRLIFELAWGEIQKYLIAIVHNNYIDYYNIIGDT